MKRRDFIARAALVAAACPLPKFGFASVRGDDRIKVGLVGCGGRGTGAACNMIAADPNVKIVAVADLFADKHEWTLNTISDFAKAFRLGGVRRNGSGQSQKIRRLGLH